MVLYALCLPQQALVDAQTLQPPLAATYIVNLGRAILNGAPEQVFGICADVVTLRLDFGKVVNGQLAVRILGEVLERDLGLALPDHHMHDDEAFEDNGPCRVAQAVGESTKDLSDACLTGMRCDEDMLDIFGLGGGELDLGAALDAFLEGARHEARVRRAAARSRAWLGVVGSQTSVGRGPTPTYRQRA